MSKYCTYCGKSLDSDATFCTECGSTYDSSYKDDKPKARIDRSLILPAIGLVLSNSAPLVGLIISIIAFKKSDKYEGRGRAIALSGIISASIWLLCIIAYILIIVIRVRKDLGY